MTHEDIEASKAPLLSHLVELRSRLIRSLAVFIGLFAICFYFSKDLYNILLVPYAKIAGPEARLIYTAPQEYFFTEMRVAFYAAAFFSFPVIFGQIYAFVAPGLYKSERNAFLPFLIATPVLFALGGGLVYFVVMPNLLTFFLEMQQNNEPGRPQIQMLPTVSLYLNLIMQLILAFGITFQMPIALTLLGRAGIVSSRFLLSKWRYAIVIVVAIAALLTPPDLTSMIALAIPAMLLYAVSIILVKIVEPRR